MVEGWRTSTSEGGGAMEVLSQNGKKINLSKGKKEKKHRERPSCSVRRKKGKAEEISRNGGMGFVVKIKGSKPAKLSQGRGGGGGVRFWINLGNRDRAKEEVFPIEKIDSSIKHRGEKKKSAGKRQDVAF